MRRGELLGLQWDDVDLRVPQVTVSVPPASISTGLQLKGTKLERSRTLFLDDTAAVLDHQPRREGRWPLVFTGATGDPLPPLWVGELCHPRADRRRTANGPPPWPVQASEAALVARGRARWPAWGEQAAGDIATAAYR